ncbi:nuclear transport factor 2 family protein [Flavobacteriaceae bacterium]|jgi:ketosteroid isomerase-like protein|nr:nuclear transport factor 2 family protein [Flavobacteriaceae bacterium]MDB4595848.1 nuclear transport factor 2 family protein [Flavobacteriaceae bacterium]MDC0984693.1 nuclear transport factor 2 family protein [Flavobacteriaceae bacterium]|tara:strand:+ start:267 stop:758 length:492 start_codon:yes stop_codon:yes gene_type:complete
MKKILLIGLFGLILSCSNVQHPDFAANVESAKTFLELQGTEADLQAQLDLVHEDMQWQPAFHGSSQIGKEAFGEYLKGWHDAMENVVYTPVNYLPGVLAETGLQDGSVRSYGKWTGVHTETGKSWELISYHTWDFKDGLIISGGDYFDAGGLLSSLASNESAD